MRDGAGLAGMSAGFAAPVAAAQRVFRLALDAMAHPGRVVTVPDDVLSGERCGMPLAAAALCLSLCDGDTPIWLDRMSADSVTFLRFHCGAPVVDDPGASRFALAGNPAALPDLERFDLGSAEFPDRSTTLILEVQRLAPGEGLALRGPGIDGSTTLGVAGVPAALWTARAALAPRFPLGLDMFLTCGGSFAALPRTTVVES
jgi:alpha-D-ribose 1-methylphosphonate 5-triphosphate synthase subunit PhnH